MPGSAHQVPVTREVYAARRRVERCLFVLVVVVAVTRGNERCCCDRCGDGIAIHVRPCMYHRNIIRRRQTGGGMRRTTFSSAHPNRLPYPRRQHHVGAHTAHTDGATFFSLASRRFRHGARFVPLSKRQKLSGDMSSKAKNVRCQGGRIECATL